MNKSPILKRLEQARRHVADGDKSLSRQRKVVVELEQNGLDTTVARQLLETFERTQADSAREVVQLEKQAESTDLLPLARERAQLCAEQARLILDPMTQASWRAQANAWAILADYLESNPEDAGGSKTA